MNLQCTAMFLLNALLISGVNEVIRNTEYGRVRGILSAEGQSYLGIQIFPIRSSEAMDSHQVGGAVWAPVYTTPCILSKCSIEL